MSLDDEINTLKRIIMETSNSEIEELLKNLVKSLETRARAIAVPASIRLNSSKNVIEESDMDLFS